LFVFALEGNPIEITPENFTELCLLSEEFGFLDLSSQLLKFESVLKAQRMHTPGVSLLPPLRNTLLCDSFQFVINGVLFESDVVHAIALSPAVSEQLSVDGCARKFVLNEGKLSSEDISSLQSLLSGEEILSGQSLASVSRILGNADFERLFIGRLRKQIRGTLLTWPMKMRIDFKSVCNSILSFDALDRLLLTESISIESEDALLDFIFKSWSELSGIVEAYSNWLFE
jgi:hypothetical protein